ncbi:hypothetical protein [Plesiomonas shigelloides]|uniref:Restriction endonuclease type IV Mrr domain-containing protein n=1 Tax=Plesiomonas shigelloides 302-73 TaxID=1315976 RepID=R8AQX6_PLESH|nr:hypothetical protein [Plesiomonas shigelloides]EON88730.1 hypothetical protein PLESHI_09074 [Plesiomonas shigelloides 302-73]
MTRNYWGYRIDTNNIDFFRRELENGILRQGWGWDSEQDLRDLKMDEGAKRNLSIYLKVKKNDILLIPRCPSWNEVGVAIATADFDEGYNFSIDTKLGDYGHCFPAKLLKTFVRNNENISGQIRATIKNISRFWNINHCSTDIDKIINTNNLDLITEQTLQVSFENAINDSFDKAFNHQNFSNYLYDKVTSKFSNEEWEFALAEGLKSIFPEPIVVERTGGIQEVEHGTDILIRLPGLLGFQYLIAIQVKDYSGIVGNDPISQIQKSDLYWSNENSRVIDKYLIITKANKDDNSKLIQNSDGVKIIFANELQELLATIGKSYLGLSDN